MDAAEQTGTIETLFRTVIIISIVHGGGYHGENGERRERSTRCADAFKSSAVITAAHSVFI